MLKKLPDTDFAARRFAAGSFFSRNLRKKTPDTNNSTTTTNTPAASRRANIIIFRHFYAEKKTKSDKFCHESSRIKTLKKIMSDIIPNFDWIGYHSGFGLMIFYATNSPEIFSPSRSNSPFCFLCTA